MVDIQQPGAEEEKAFGMLSRLPAILYSTLMNLRPGWMAIYPTKN
jgi:hypothetical protein